jgi:hypothetical protein
MLQVLTVAYFLPNPRTMPSNFNQRISIVALMSASRFEPGDVAHLRQRAGNTIARISTQLKSSFLHD